MNRQASSVTLLSILSACVADGHDAAFEDLHAIDTESFVDSDGVDPDQPDGPSDADPGVPSASDLQADAQAIAAPGDPYPVTLPFRAEDLRPREMWAKSTSNHGSGPCHGEACALDIHAVRWAESLGEWVSTRAGTSGSAVGNDVGFGKPVYAVTSGQVVACWQNFPDTPTTDNDGSNCQCNPGTGAIDCGSPTGSGWVACDTVMRRGGNVMVVRGDDGVGIAYAHFQQGSIPNELCPNNPTQVFPDSIQQPCSGCAPAEYLTCPPGGAGVDCDAGDRPHVEAGDFIGRVGNSSTRTPHIHMEANEYAPSGNDNFSEDDSLDSRFSSSWFQVRQPTGPGAWAELDNTSVKGLYAAFGTLILWPGAKHEKTYTASTHMADYNGDGDDDLLCHNTASGTLYLDFASAGQLNGTDGSSMPNAWCNNSGGTQRLHTGDFNADGRGDILCHDIETGKVWIDYANFVGRFGGTDESQDSNFCNGDTQEAHIGDFDDDGRDDMYCHDYATNGIGSVYFARSYGVFPESTPVPAGWCKGAYQRVHTGDFGSDGRDDRLCHDTRTGQIWIDFASSTAFGTPIFSGTDQTPAAWCKGLGTRLYVGQVNGGSLDDLVCHDSDAASGKIWVDYGTLSGTDWSSGSDGWCTGPAERLRIGDVDGDGRDDLVCFDIETGSRSVDYAVASGHTSFFMGPDWEASGLWCYAPDQALH